MKNLIISIFVVFLFSPSISLAAETVALDGVVMTYESGKIDPNTGNGTAKGVEFIYDNGDVLNIDRYHMKSRPDGDRYFIETLNFSGVTASFEDSIIVNIKDISVTDVKSTPNGDRYFIETLNFSGVTAGVEDAIIVNIKDISATDVEIILNDDDGGTMSKTMMEINSTVTGSIIINAIAFYVGKDEAFSIDQISLDNNFTNPIVDITSIPLGELYDSTMNIVNLSVDLSKNENANSLLFREKLGIDHLNMNISMRNKINGGEDRINSDTNIALMVDDIGGIDFSVDIGLLKTSLVSLAPVFAEAMLMDNIYDISEDEKKALGEKLLAELLAELFVGGFFNSADFTIVDDGVLTLAIAELASEQGISRADVVNSGMEMMAAAMGQIMPKTYSNIAPTIRNFLEQVSQKKGGELAISLNPESPLPFSTLAIFALDPDQGATTLGLNVTHQP